MKINLPSEFFVLQFFIIFVAMNTTNEQNILPQRQKYSSAFLLLTVLFCTSLVASNFLETKVIGVCRGFNITGGLLVFPISYIIGDCISEVWGFAKTRIIIWLGFAMNFLVVIMGGIAVALPSAPFWDGAEHFNYIFALAPRMVIASLLAFLVGSFLNATVMSRMKASSSAGQTVDGVPQETSAAKFSLRAILSTLAGESADSLIFFPIAFGGLMPWKELLMVMIIQVGLKTIYEILVLPLTIKVVRMLKKHEQMDVYDTDISYNPFHIHD